MAMTPYSDNSIMTNRQDFSSAMKQRIGRLKEDADRLFSLGGVRQRCQEALSATIAELQPSQFSDWGKLHSDDSEYRFAWMLTMTYQSTKAQILQWVEGCGSEFLLSEVREERQRTIEEFARMRIASRWYQMKDDDKAWRVFSKNIPFNQPDREKEVNEFFELLDRICILTDILTGHACEYGLEVDYHSEKEEQLQMSNTETSLSDYRQSILDRLLDLADKGDWLTSADDVKAMLKTLLSQSETSLKGDEVGISEKLWKLLENGRGDRVKIVWQNLIGYFADRKLLPSTMGAPALNKMFFGDEAGYTNIDKGRPSKGLMTADFESLVPLLDAFLPKA